MKLGEKNTRFCIRTMLLHNTKEFDDDFRAGPYKNLSFPSLFGIVDCIESVIEDAGFDHNGDVRFSTRQ